MASQAGSPPDALAFLAALKQEAPGLDFFQVLRRLEALHPEYPGFGRSARPVEDPIRLGQNPFLQFAPGMLAGFGQSGVRNPRPRLGQYFFGLFGPNGPLPQHLTEHALQRQRNEKDATFAAFADLFHHRMLSLLYRAWAAARPTVSFDRSGKDRFSAYIGAPLGLAQESLRNRDELLDRAKLHYAGILAAQTRHTEGLQVMLADFLCVPVAILEFQGAWMSLPANYWLRLGTSASNSTLGETAVLGSEVWGCQQRFRLVLGPLSLVDFRRLLPTGQSIRRLKAIIRNYLGDEKDWDVRLILRRAEMPRMALGQLGELGWTTWLRDQVPTADLDDLVLSAAN